jgi:hypothetical protein
MSTEPYTGIRVAECKNKVLKDLRKIYEIFTRFFEELSKMGDRSETSKLMVFE